MSRHGATSVYRSLRGRYEVSAFSARCPRCGGELKLKANARVEAVHGLACYQCHHEPRLIMG